MSKACCCKAQVSSGSVALGGDGCLCGVFLPEGALIPDGFQDDEELDLDVMNNEYYQYTSVLKLGLYAGPITC